MEKIDVIAKVWVESAVGIACALVAPSVAWSQVAKVGGGLGVEAGVAKVAEDYFVGLRLEGAYQWEVGAIGCEDFEPCETTLKLAGQVPLRLRVADSEPEDDGVVREFDWDEVGDWSRVLRRVEYGAPSEVLHARVGLLGPTSLGHGTLMRDYYNVVDVDHVRPGAEASFNTRYGGLEVLLDDITRPRLVGSRLYGRPGAWFEGPEWSERLAWGVTLVVDAAAPTRLSRDEGGAIVVEETREPVVEASRATALVGVDMEMAVVDTDVWSVVPYVDFNVHPGYGSGLHAGGFFGWAGEGFSVELQGEYRRGWERYLPDYVGALYEVERLVFNGWGLEGGGSKLGAIEQLPSEVREGVLGGIKVDVEGVGAVEASWADHGSGENEQMRLRLVAAPHEKVQMGVFAYNQYVGALADILDRDNLLVASEARVDVYRPLYLFGGYGRSWRLVPGEDYEPVDDWEVGLGASWRL